MKKFYTVEHELLKIEGNKANISITDHAVEALGEVVFVELPELNKEYGSGDVIAVLETVKAASEVYTPIKGKVIQINNDLEERPELMSEKETHICTLEIIDFDSKGLMNEEEYNSYLKKINN